MWRLIALLFLGIFPASSVLAWNEPTGFRDIPWGTKPEVVRQRFPDFTCKRGEKVIIQNVCLGKLMIGDIHVSTLLGFDTGGLDLVQLFFDSKDYPAMKETFLARYGATTSQKKTLIRNRLGVEFDNDILEWRGARVVIVLEQYGDTLSESYAVMETTEGIQWRNARIREQKQQRKKGL
jgi:hypothetical protein